MDSFYIGVLSSIVGGLLLGLIYFLIRRLKERHAPFTGIWENRIRNSEGEVIKRDRSYMRQRGNFIYGTCSRLIPENQTDRAWKFAGRVAGSSIYFIYWSTDPRRFDSHGCLAVRQESRDLYKGYYLKVDKNTFQMVPHRVDMVRIPKPEGTVNLESLI